MFEYCEEKFNHILCIYKLNHKGKHYGFEDDEQVRYIEWWSPADTIRNSPTA